VTVPRNPENVARRVGSGKTMRKKAFTRPMAGNTGVARAVAEDTSATRTGKGGVWIMVSGRVLVMLAVDNWCRFVQINEIRLVVLRRGC